VKILVTGAAGFVGSHLCETLLARGHSVVGLDSFDPHYPRAFKEWNLAQVRAVAGDFSIVEGDVRDLPARPMAADAVVHLAALADMRHSLEDPVTYTRINIDGTLAVLESCRRAGIRNVVFASSSLVYGNRTSVPFRESDPADAPVSLYAATKSSGELLCRVYQQLYGINVTCLRFFTVFGPRQRPEMAIHKFARQIARGGEIPVHGFGKLSRDYVYVTDVAAGVALALERMGGWRVYNIGSATARSLMDVVKLLEQEMKIAARVAFLPEQPGDVPLTYASIDLARAELGYSPKVTMEEGMRRFVEWYLGTARQIELELDKRMDT